MIAMPQCARARGDIAKRSYRRSRDAVKAARKMSRPMRPYFCPQCGFYHLTSQPVREGQSGRRFK